MSQVPDAWVSMPSEAELREQRGGGGAYDFGFVPNMGRLLASHPTIGPAFGALFATVMFQPGALDRREKELVAAAADPR